MLVKEWMTEEVLSIDEETSLMEANQFLREKKVGQLPVLNKKGKLVGMVSDRDIKAASPSKATTLDVHELYYLLSKVLIKEVMTKNPITVSPDDTVLRAAVIMLEKKVSGLPVLDGKGNLVGILTKGDVFRVLTAITGVYRGGVLVVFDLEDRPGSLKEVADMIRSAGGRMNSILTSYDTAPTGHRTVSYRVLGLNHAQEQSLIEDLGKKFTLKYWVRDELKGL
jgi:acetoin utilization protein AcuB